MMMIFGILFYWFYFY